MTERENVARLDDVRPRHGDGQAVVAAPSIGSSITMNLGGEAQLVLQSFFERDATDAEANGVIDKMFRLARRQKAHYDLEKHTGDLATREKALGRLNEDFAKVEKQYRTKIAAWQVEIGTLNAMSNEAKDRGYRQHVDSGRRAEYKPQGGVADTMNKARIGIAAIQGEIDKASNERAQNIEVVEKSRERFEEDIAADRIAIAKCRALLELAGE